MLGGNLGSLLYGDVSVMLRKEFLENFHIKLYIAQCDRNCNGDPTGMTAIASLCLAKTAYLINQMALKDSGRGYEPFFVVVFFMLISIEHEI